MYLIDTHAHLDSSFFDRDRDALLARAHSAGVRQIIVPAVDFNNFDVVLSYHGRYPGVYVAIGIYPRRGKDWQPSDIERVRRSARQPGVVAIGEIGLEYAANNRTPPAIQRDMLSAHLELAAELTLPAILHNRLACTEVLDVFATSSLAKREAAGVLHGFEGDYENARRAIDLGLYISFYGPVTFHTKKYAALLPRLPIDRVMLETDAPCMAPFPYRGRRSEPAHTRLVAEAIARYTHCNLEEIATITTRNAQKVFRLPEDANGKEVKELETNGFIPPRWGKKGLEW
ncbi:MAG TPA: TatD family hydrolase [Longilinea sp.]|nr:TatD family hydrolase [Longilinea sp.]